jgi:hypothetical protein
VKYRYIVRSSATDATLARRSLDAQNARAHRRCRQVGAHEHAEPLGGGHEHPAEIALGHVRIRWNIDRDAERARDTRCARFVSIRLFGLTPTGHLLPAPCRPPRPRIPACTRCCRRPWCRRSPAHPPPGRSDPSRLRSVSIFPRDETRNVATRRAARGEVTDVPASRPRKSLLTAAESST